MHIEKFKSLLFAVFACALFALFSSGNASALSFTVAPMYQILSLEAGQTETSDFRVYNPDDSQSDLEYELVIRPFFKDNNNTIIFESHESFSEITKWIKLSETSGTLKPGEGKNIEFSITVPSSAPASGEYAAILVKTKGESVSTVNQDFSMAHLIYADVAGHTVHSGELKEPSVPGFLFSGNISGSITAVNHGNTHAYIAHSLSVKALFSGEEVYSTGDTPLENLVMPETSRLVNAEWEQTPGFGFFKVIYKAEFEGETKSLEKLVIVCPLWLLILFATAFALVFVFTLYRLKSNRKAAEM